MTLGPRDRRYYRTTRARETGRPVTVAHAADWTGRADAVGWVTVCVDHGTAASYPTLALARAAASAPTEWCRPCRVLRAVSTWGRRS